MIRDMKCLATPVVVVIILSVLDICSCKPDFALDSVLEKTQADVAAVPDGEVEPIVDDKRAWSKFVSWGKRGWNKNLPLWGRKRWGNFATWGKRSVDSASTLTEDPGDDKRAWAKFNSWGKRDGGEDDKRKWAGLATWGKRGDELPLEEKRKWSQFASWGKRDSVDSDVDKRKWSQFASWGKRNFDELPEAEKRKWSQFASWGKRDSDEGGADKRGKWSQFSAWGKRDGDDDLATDMDKRKWSSFTSWGKRRWNGLATWGKRSGPVDGTVVDTVASRLLDFFDDNDDGALDKTELRNYIITLMSLPSEPEVIKTM